MSSRSVITTALTVLGFVVACNTIVLHSSIGWNDISTTDDIKNTIEIYNPEDSLNENAASKVYTPSTVASKTVILSNIHSEPNENTKTANDAVEGTSEAAKIDAIGTEVQPDPNQDINDGSTTDSNKPKLFLHVGPRKTATTTIQISVLRSPDYVSPVLAGKDNIVNIDYDWSAGVALAEQCMDLLPDDCDMDHWHAFVIRLDNAYEKKQNVIVSNEALSLIQGNEHTKKLMLTLTEKWDVRIIIAYRSIETW